MNITHAVLGCADLLKSIGSPYGASISAALLSQRWNDVLAPCPLDPCSYKDPEEFARDYAAVSLLSKSDFLPSGVNLKEVALKKFRASEETCYSSNIRLRAFNREIFPLTSLVPSVIQTARRKIESLLGVFSWDECSNHFGFGPGASIGLTHSKGHSVFKYGSKEPSVTGLCLDLARAAILSSPLWATTIGCFPAGDPPFVIVRGNKVTTVPKNSSTDRVIAIEPLMNMYVQRGIGGVIRDRLRYVGVDLHDQSKNQRYARLGSIDGTLATLDLSAASDSISLGCVELLLPDDWVLALKLTRSEWGVLPDGSEIRYQKVSSMGNGFTFELESLIFWAICSSVVETLRLSDRRIAVYGDDLIVPTDAVDGVTEILSYLGFSLNKEKSFWTGPFRESCGKHYFTGSDVTPLYVRKNIETLQRRIWFINSIARLAHRFKGEAFGRCSSLHQVYLDQLGRLPVALRKPTIPWNFGDGGVCGDLDEVRPRRHRYFDAWVVRSFSGRLRPVRVPDSSYVACLASMEGKPHFPEVSHLRPPFGLPHLEVGWKKGVGCVHTWEELGPWW